MKKILVFLFVLLVNSSFAQDEQLVWPREIESGKYVITLYQPQLETLSGNNLDGRMAISIKKGNDDLIFGASWFTVQLDTDKSSRTAVLENLDITKIKFPDIKDKRNITCAINIPYF